VDRLLLNRAEVFLSKVQARNERKRLLIHCRQAEPGYRNSLPTSCLGEITENSILGAAILGFDEVALTNWNCSQCRFKYGGKLLAKSIATARELLSGLGLGGITLRLIEKDRKKSQVMNRRAIFSKISVRMQTEAESDSRERKVRRQLPGRLKDQGGAWHSPKKDHLRELLERNGKTDLVVKYSPELSGGRLRGQR
jgi:coenzyme F420-reducing hydrogenase delta subunit